MRNLLIVAAFLALATGVLWRIRDAQADTAANCRFGEGSWGDLAAAMGPRARTARP